MNQSLVEKLQWGIGKRVLVMTGAFPFFVVGILQDVRGDNIHVITEFGVPAPLKNQEFCIHLEHIAAFYVEERQGEIPVVW